MNALPRYVASRTRMEITEWNDRLLDGVLGTPANLTVAERNGSTSGTTVLTLVPRDAS